MLEVNPLTDQFKTGLGWHQARIHFLVLFLEALIKVRTVNLTEIATAMDGRAKVASNYKRLQRFLHHYPLDFVCFTQWMMSWVKIEQPWLLCLDRTNWEFGKTPINFLVLAVAYKGAAIPLFWTLLSKKGNSSTRVRKALINRFRRAFPGVQVACLTADREFRGEQWIRFLKKAKIPFRIRIPNNTLATNKRGNALLHVRRLFMIQPGEVMVLNKPRQVWGITVHLAATRTLAGEHVIIITDRDPSTALSDYCKRWEIETLFGCLKSRGFNLEQTHLSKRKRISKLFALLAVAFAWAYQLGIWQSQKRPIKLKKHRRLAQSLFRCGLDCIRHILLNRTSSSSDYREVVNVLSCT
uniref:Transposase n=1 Tax=Magnetococcus massalia (strain MO-1) TaxID=451514 RepID=A0A1S7LFT6_MAGMO|nr:Transposase [Candidatus Magnetococcus massalia]CRH05597.1 Transposase [Candidatus Magnetococcus massalia]CRH06389.1 Transposase [Candidatus Magnetococcus massalia]CRH06727.1 Transposase [Candidatus Magnetococcus massalia]